VVLDASWHLPGAGRDAEAEFREARIPGARRFDIDAISDEGSLLPHTAPSAAAFRAAMGALGIGPGHAGRGLRFCGPVLGRPRVGGPSG
jgi:thiosulfate/3-mercaptopyruvate sulfurtransferase